MGQNDTYAREIEKAKAALKQVEDEKGSNDIAVAGKLDALAQLMRAAKVDEALATRYEQQARVIRVRHQNADKERESDSSREVREGIRARVEQEQRRKTRNSLIMLGIVTLIGLYVGKLYLMPSAQEKEYTEAFMTSVQTMNPSTLVNSFVDNSTEAARAAAEKSDEHADEVNKMLETAK